jgi:hypothetical protein
MRHLLVTYDHATEAIEAATALEEAQVADAVLIPRPRTLKAGCGVALRTPLASASRVIGLLLRAGKLGATYAGEQGRAWQPRTTDELLAGDDPAEAPP